MNFHSKQRNNDSRSSTGSSNKVGRADPSSNAMSKRIAANHVQAPSGNAQRQMLQGKKIGGRSAKTVPQNMDSVSGTDSTFSDEHSTPTSSSSTSSSQSKLMKYYLNNNETEAAKKLGEFLRADLEAKIEKARAQYIHHAGELIRLLNTMKQPLKSTSRQSYRTAQLIKKQYKSHQRKMDKLQNKIDNYEHQLFLLNNSKNGRDLSEDSLSTFSSSSSGQSSSVGHSSNPSIATSTTLRNRPFPQANNRPTPVGSVCILSPYNNSHPFDERRIPMPCMGVAVKIGRSSADAGVRLQPSPSNAIFDCKVVSRNHAVLWLSSSGQLLIKDMRSSNGTFINNERLEPYEERELCSGDILQLGIDAVDKVKKELNSCVTCKVRFVNPQKTKHSTIVPVLQQHPSCSHTVVHNDELFTQNQQHIGETKHRENLLEIQQQRLAQEKMQFKCNEQVDQKQFMAKNRPCTLFECNENGEAEFIAKGHMKYGHSFGGRIHWCEIMDSQNQENKTYLKFFAFPTLSIEIDHIDQTKCTWKCKDIRDASDPFDLLKKQYLEDPAGQNCYGAKFENAMAAKEFQLLMEKLAKTTNLPVYTRIKSVKGEVKNFEKGRPRAMYQIHVATLSSMGIREIHTIHRTFDECKQFITDAEINKLKSSVNLPKTRWRRGLWRQKRYTKEFLNRRAQALEKIFNDLANIPSITTLAVWHEFIKNGKFDSKYQSNFDSEDNLKPFKRDATEMISKMYESDESEWNRSTWYSKEEMDKLQLDVAKIYFGASLDEDQSKNDSTNSKEHNYNRNQLKLARQIVAPIRSKLDQHQRQQKCHECGEMAVEMRKVLICLKTPDQTFIPYIVLSLRIHKIYWELKKHGIDKTTVVEHFFLDMEGRAYTIWTNFLEENKLPYCFMAYPAMDQKNELQFEDIEEEDGTQRRKVKMEFRHTRKRMWLLRAGDKIINGINLFTFAGYIAINVVGFLVVIPFPVSIALGSAALLSSIHNGVRLGLLELVDRFRHCQSLVPNSWASLMPWVHLFMPLLGYGLLGGTMKLRSMLLTAIRMGQLRFLSAAIGILHDVCLCCRHCVGLLNMGIMFAAFIDNFITTGELPSLWQFLQMVPGIYLFAYNLCQLPSQLSGPMTLREQKAVLGIFYKALKPIKWHTREPDQLIDSLRQAHPQGKAGFIWCDRHAGTPTRDNVSHLIDLRVTLEHWQQMLVKAHGEVIGNDYAIYDMLLFANDRELLGNFYGLFHEYLDAGREIVWPEDQSTKMGHNITVFVDALHNRLSRADAFGATSSSAHGAGTVDAFCIRDHIITKKWFHLWIVPLFQYDKEVPLDTKVKCWVLDLNKGELHTNDHFFKSHFVVHANGWEILECYANAGIDLMTGNVAGAIGRVGCLFATEFYGPRAGAIVQLGAILAGDMINGDKLRIIKDFGALAAVTLEPMLGPEFTKFIHVGTGFACSINANANGAEWWVGLDEAVRPLGDALGMPWLASSIHCAIGLHQIDEGHITQGTGQCLQGMKLYLIDAMGLPPGAVSAFFRFNEVNLHAPAEPHQFQNGDIANVSAYISFGIAVTHPGIVIVIDGKYYVVDNNSLSSDSYKQLLLGGSKGGVRIHSWEDFAKIGTKGIVWKDNREYHFGKSHYTGKQTVQNACNRIGERAYDLWRNDCQHFVNKSRYGISASTDVREFWEQRKPFDIIADVRMQEAHKSICVPPDYGLFKPIELKLDGDDCVGATFCSEHMHGKGGAEGDKHSLVMDNNLNMLSDSKHFVLDKKCDSGAGVRTQSSALGDLVIGTTKRIVWKGNMAWEYGKCSSIQIVD